MQEGDGSERIADNEIIYRRLPSNAEYYDPACNPPIQWIAFKPNEHDSTGISVWRAKSLSRAEAATLNARRGKSYYLVAIKVAELRRLGAEIESTPVEGGAGHASIVSLSWRRYQSEKNAVMELAQRLARDAHYEVHGPFHVGAE